jgi:hypothetical protein
MELNGTHQPLVYADNVNLLGDSTNTIKVNLETLLEACHWNSGQNQNIRIANESFEKVPKFKYLGMTLTHQNDIHDELE